VKKELILGICITAFVVIAAGAPNAFGWGTVSNCWNCHSRSDFLGPGQPLHDSHNSFISGCSTCHRSTGDVPDINNSASDGSKPSCAGCHVGNGLQLHHINSGVTTCKNCHGTPTSVPENDAPPYYGTSSTTIVDPCVSSPSPPGEDANGNGKGLDNDGDLLYDEADPDCAQPVCGDGNVDPGEQCDDGNTNNYDGCRRRW